MVRRSFVIITVLMSLILPALAGTVYAQGGQDQCLQLIRQMLTDLGTNCANTESNTACYGFERVTAAFMEPVEEDFFTEPGDRAELTSLVTLTMSDIDVRESIWGVSALHVQGNIHNALPDQAVFLAIGDIELENAVDPETALLPVEPVSIPTTVEAGLYAGPDAGTELWDTVPVGTVLQVDGISPDGLWLRTFYFNEDDERYYLAWVSSTALDQTVDVSSLPTIGPDTQTPMQTFFLRSGFGGGRCPQALPPLLLVQGPENTDVDITVNGAHIRIGGTVMLEILRPGRTMRLFTLYGLATINPGMEDELQVPPGASVTVCLSDPDDYGGLDGVDNDQIVSCDWSGRRRVNQGDLNALALIEDLPDNILNYPLEIPTIIKASAVGGPREHLFFRNPKALEQARRLCDADILPEEICDYLFP
ncbi:MAG: hypothetical protein JW910_23310 [Anaerolineae bacterium]|nr:hypothetical protein [Anaerolineae bacterium]